MYRRRGKGLNSGRGERGRGWGWFKMNDVYPGRENEE